MTDPHDLDRFVRAQADTHDTALAEMRAGTKRTHWMWFVFPQIAGLGRSATAKAYAIASAQEARAYLAHPLLGTRLHEAIAAALTSGRDAEAIFGAVDAMKLRSSLTLFAAVADAPDPFERAIAHFFGSPDTQTLALLGDAVQPASTPPRA